MSVVLGASLAVPHARAQRSAPPPLHVVLVVDGSTAMARHDPRLATRAAAKLLVDLLGPRDSITLSSYAETPGAPSTVRAAEGERVWAAIDALPRTAERADWGAGIEGAAAVVDSPQAGDFQWLVVVLDASSSASSRPQATLDAAARTLESKGALTFVVSIGPEPDANDAASTATLRAMSDVAERTGGSRLAAPDDRAVMRALLDVLGARVGFLVGEPVRLDQPRPRVAVRSAVRRMMVVVPTGDRVALRWERHPPAPPPARVVRPDGGAGSEADAGRADARPALRPSDAGAGVAVPWPFGRDREGFFRRDAHRESVSGGAGYTLVTIDRPARGDYEIAVEPRARGAVEAFVIRDAGLRLRLQGIGSRTPPRRTLTFGVLLRAADGGAVELSSEVRRSIEVEVRVGPHRVERLLLDAQGAGEASVPPLEPGTHVVEARLRHFAGLVQVEPARLTTTANLLSTVMFKDLPVLAFDELAADRLVAHLDVSLRPGGVLEPHTFDLRLVGLVHADELELVPASIVVRPDVLKIRVGVRVKDPLRLRRSGRTYGGQILLVPRSPEKLRGRTTLSVALRGRVRPWTAVDWLDAYKWQGIGALVAAIAAAGALLARRRRAQRTTQAVPPAWVDDAGGPNDTGPGGRPDAPA